MQAVQAVLWNEQFLTEVPISKMTRDQLGTRAIRMILDSRMVSRSGLQAIPNSFKTIADVRAINMCCNDLRVVPECINLLTGLRELLLSYCKLNRDDSIPDTLWQLAGLEKLRLYDNNLTSIPSQIGQLSSLTFLNLSINNLVNLPDEIYQLTNLTELYLDNNKLESISEEIGNLTNLTRLWLYNNKLKSLPKSIGNLVNLEDGYLAINGNPLIKSLPDSIRIVINALWNPNDAYKFDAMVDHAEYRVACRVQRRLVIILAKEPKEVTRQATKDKKVSFVNDILKDPKLVRLICKFMDWKPYLDDEDEDHHINHHSTTSNNTKLNKKNQKLKYNSS